MTYFINIFFNTNITIIPTTKHKILKNKSLLVKNNVIIQNDHQQNFLVTKSGHIKYTKTKNLIRKILDFILFT